MEETITISSENNAELAKRLRLDPPPLQRSLAWWGWNLKSSPCKRPTKILWRAGNNATTYRRLPQITLYVEWSCSAQCSSTGAWATESNGQTFIQCKLDFVGDTWNVGSRFGGGSPHLPLDFRAATIFQRPPYNAAPYFPSTFGVSLGFPTFWSPRHFSHSWWCPNSFPKQPPHV